MHLIAPLISGVANCGNGTAAIFSRGTGVPAQLFSSFEGDAFSSSQLNASDRVILDSYGRAKVYVNELCDVSVYDLQGQLQVSFTAGSAASAIEVRSESFTGNAYETGASAAGNPTTLQAVLDAWIAAQSNTDWLVSGTVQPFVIVTDPAYGAVGNGVNDDTAAVQAAINRAKASGSNQAIVFFPPGTYRVTSVLTTGGAILLGSGTSATRYSKLLIDNSNSSLFTVSLGRTIARDMILGSAQANSATLMALGAGGILQLEDCAVGDGFCDGHLVTNSGAGTLTARDTTFTIGSDTASVLTGGNGSFDRCTFSGSGLATYTGDGYLVGNIIHARGCQFNASHTGGTLTGVKYTTAAVVGSVHSCQFSAATSGTADVVGMNLGTYSSAAIFAESGNRFPTASDTAGNAFKAYDYTAHADNRFVHLGTREHRILKVADDAFSPTLPTDQYGTIILSSVHTSPQFAGVRPPAGSRGRVLFYHPSGGAGTATPGTNFFGGTAATTADTSTHAWEYICCNVNATLRMMITVNGFACGNGA